MANKASKSLARTNRQTLTRTHLTTATLHLIFILYRLFFRRGSLTKYLLLSTPSLLIEFYLDKLGRPRFAASTGELLSPGEDLAAMGVTEYLWDIVYSTWICLGLVAVLGEWAWWCGLVVPGYATYLAWGLWSGMRRGEIPGMPAAKGEEEKEKGTSKRQTKMEARMEQRGGQKVKHR